MDFSSHCQSSKSVLAVADLKVECATHRVERAGQRIKLADREFAVLEYLMHNTGRCVTRSMIIKHVWNRTIDTTTNLVDVYVNYLRRKIDDGHARKLIHTVRGVGYELSCPTRSPHRAHCLGATTSVRL
jgi:DNA-binding response OmpR family regulator